VFFFFFFFPFSRSAEQPLLQFVLSIFFSSFYLFIFIYFPCVSVIIEREEEEEEEKRPAVLCAGTPTGL
jgi:hypothetical protein